MAINYEVETKHACEECGEEMCCVDCKYENAAHLLPITDGERDVLRDVLNHTKQLHAEGKASMSAMDASDLADLIRKVDEL